MSAQPVFFGPASMPLFGWLHGLDGAHQDVGIVLCSPWGREEVSAHQSIRQWALQLAQAGWPCIRFDYASEGDSAGDALLDGSVEAWVESARMAGDELKARTGVHKLCFLGIRSGAAMAALAAQGRRDVLAMIGVAPVVKGRSYVRELTALHAATNRLPQDRAPADVFQSGGYVMSLITREALAAVDLTQLPTSPAPHVLVLDRDDMPPSAPWVKALQALGADVRQQALPGYVGMMSDPHLVQTPQAMIDASLGWLQEVIVPASSTDRRPKATVAIDVPSKSALLPVPGHHQAGALIREQALVLPGSSVFGILSTHASEAVRSGHAIVLLNAGSTRRIGSSRMSVEQARRWAAQGHAVLRIDLAGVGDAQVRSGRPQNLSYPHEAVADVKAAIDFLRQMSGISHVHACGLCSGAYHALKAARDGLQIDTITLINPLVYFNAEGLSPMDSLDLSPQKVHSAAASYKAAATSLDKWVKLFKGQVQVGVLLKVFAMRVGMTLGVKLREVARAVRWPLKDDLATELRRLNQKGVRVHFVFAKGDPGEIMLREMTGSALGSLQKGGRLSLRVFDDADHVFTDLGLRRDMLAYLDQVMADTMSSASGVQALPVKAAATLTS